MTVAGRDPREAESGADLHALGPVPREPVEGIIVYGADATIVSWNTDAEQLLGLSGADLAGRTPKDGAWQPRREDGSPWPHQDHPVMVTLASGMTSTAVMHLDRPDTSTVVLKVEAKAISDLTGHRQAVASLRDLSAVTAGEEALRDLTQYRLMFEHADDIITVLEEDLTVRYSSPSTERVLGYPFGLRSPGGLLNLVHPGDQTAAANALLDLVAGRRGPEPITLRLVHGSGEWRYLEVVGVNMLDTPGVRALVLTSRDITERQQLSDRLAHLAGHDHLTGLANRSLLEPKLVEVLEQVSAKGLHVGVCCIDLDGFKAVNDTFGHAAGDDLLREAADRITGAVRAGDTTIRTGGDEFVVIFQPLPDLTAALDAARRLRNTLVLPPLRRNDVTVGASVGVALSQPDEAVEALVNRADAALYRAKGQGRSAVWVDDPPGSAGG